jgi:hypothetical protein
LYLKKIADQRHTIRLILQHNEQILCATLTLYRRLYNALLQWFTVPSGITFWTTGG